jgi:hypothetical protein
MPVDADLTLRILERLQADMSEIKDDIKDVKDRLGGVERRLGAVDLRLGTVEGVLVECVTELRGVTQVVKQHGHRLDELERP